MRLIIIYLIISIAYAMLTHWKNRSSLLHFFFWAFMLVDLIILIDKLKTRYDTFKFKQDVYWTNKAWRRIRLVYLEEESLKDLVLQTDAIWVVILIESNRVKIDFKKINELIIEMSSLRNEIEKLYERQLSNKG